MASLSVGGVNNVSVDDDVRSFFLSDIVTQEEIDSVRPAVESAIRDLVSNVGGEDAPSGLDEDLTDDEGEGDGRDEVAKRRRQEASDDNMGASVETSDQNMENDSMFDFIVDKARDYQTRFVEIAKQRNIIVHLGTGMGKTLIAVLLIKHFLELHENEGENGGKMILFLVPSNALAIQQSDTLRANLDCRVGMASYRQELRGLRQGRDEQAELSRCRVLVATHGAMKNLFSSYADLFSMRRVSLLIADEVHNCVGNSIYAQIMRDEYWTCDPGARPRVLGLTASPLINHKTKDNLPKQLRELEDLMDSRVVSVHCLGFQASSLLRKEAAEQSIKPHDNLPLPQSYPQRDSALLLKSREKELHQLDDLYTNLGSFAVALYCPLLLRSLEQNVFEGETDDQFQYARDWIRELQAHSEGVARNDAVTRGRSRKLINLEELLRKQTRERSDAVGIVFAKMRITALALHRYFCHEAEEESREYIRGDLNSKHSQLHAGANVHNHIGLGDVHGKDSGDGDATCVSSLTNPTVFQSSAIDQTTALHDESLNPLLNHLNSSTAMDSKVSTGFGQPRCDAGPFESDSQFDDAEGDPSSNRDPSHSSTDLAIRLLTSRGDVNQLAIRYGRGSGLEEDDLAPDVGRNGSDSLKPIAQRSRVAFRDQANDSSDSDSTPRARNLTSSGGNTVRPGVLMGRASNLFKRALIMRKALSDIDMELLLKELQEQEANTREVLKQLRCGGINVLIATSVVEEGVDVKACSFVTAFDPIDTTKSYVQMKGRARQQDAKFIFFESHGQAHSLQDLQAKEKEILEFLTIREKAFLSADGFPDHIFADAVASDELESLRKGAYRTKHGVVTVRSAMSRLYDYVMSQPKDPAATSTRQALEAYLPRFCGDKLTLPAYIGDRAQRELQLPEEMRDRSRKDRKHLLALMACIRLHKMGLLSDRLQPLVEEDVVSWIDQTQSACLKLPLHACTDLLPPFKDNCTLHLYRVAQRGTTLETFRNVLSGLPMDLAVLTTTMLNDNDLPAFTEKHRDLGSVALSLEFLGTRTFEKEDWHVASQFFVSIFSARWKRKTGRAANSSYRLAEGGMLFPYRVCCVSGSDWEPLWDLMKRTCEEFERTEDSRIKAVQSQPDGADGLLEPRLWSPRYDKFASYVVYGGSGQLCSAPFPRRFENVKTYRDYYSHKKHLEVDPKSPLFVAQRLWRLPCRRPLEVKAEKKKVEESCTSRYRVCPGLTCVVLPQNGCLEAPIANPALLLASTFLPQMLYSLDRHLYAKMFLHHCSLSLPKTYSLLSELPVREIINVLSAKSCKEQSYERLEWLGDSVLKLVLTEVVSTSTRLSPFIDNAHEGILDILRGVLVSNERLENACQCLGFDSFILTSPLGRVSWAPSPLELNPPINQGKRQLARGKVCADFIEALLGLGYSKRGYSFAFDMAVELGLTLSVERRDLSHSYGETTDCLPERAPDLVEKLTGYRFRNESSLLRQALTHPTTANPRTRSYQRLEWIGDAVLSLAAREWIFSNFPNDEVKTMDMIATVLVCNETLAFVSLRNGIYKHIEHSYDVLPARIAAYERAIHEDHGRLWGTSPPKAMADVIESVIGAVHTRGGFEAGRVAALNALNPILELTCSLRDSSDDGHLERFLHHPKSKLKDVGGKTISFAVSSEARYASRHPNHQLWSRQGGARGLILSLPQSSASRSVVSVECRFRGRSVDLVTLADKCPVTAKNLACELVLSVLNQDANLNRAFLGWTRSIREHPQEVHDSDDEDSDDDTAADEAHPVHTD